MEIIIAISFCLIILILVIEEARISQLKNIIAYQEKPKIPDQQLFALLVLYHRRLQKSYVRNRDYEKAINHIFDSYLTTFPTYDSLVKELLAQECFSVDWRKDPLKSSDLRRLIKDRKYYTTFLVEFNKANRVNEKT